MNTIISDFKTTLNTLKLKYKQELFWALVFTVIFPLLCWYGFATGDIKLVILSIIVFLASIVSVVLGYKKYHGIKPDLTAEKDLVLEMKSQVNFLKSVLKIEKVYNFIGMCGLSIYYLFILLEKPHNTIIITIIFAVILIGIVVLLSRVQLNKVRKLEETIKTLENNVLQM